LKDDDDDNDEVDNALLDSTCLVNLHNF